MQRHVTSVFSQYQTMDNNSANSKQLEYWLKQISNPSSVPNFGYEWTLMSNQSSHQERNHSESRNQNSNSNIHEEVSFGKTAHSSIDRDKENNSLVSNGNNNSNTFDNKSKSYVNAMLALQKKVKTLQDENTSMRKNLSKIYEQKNKSICESSVTQEELRNRIKVMEQKLMKMDELIQENKVLRQTKEDKNRKIKTLQKNYNEVKSKYSSLEKKYEEAMNQKNQSSTQIQSKNKRLSQLEGQLKRLYEKNKMLEDMKEKSAVALIEKYKNSIEHSEALEKQNLKLKNTVESLKSKHNEEIRVLTESHGNEIKKCHIEFEKLKENISLKESLIQEKRRQAEYFRQAYEKKGEEFMELIKSQHRSQSFQNSNERRLPQRDKIKIKQAQVSQATLKENLEQPLQASKQNSIQLPQTLIPGEKMSFAGIESQECDEEFDQSCIPDITIPVETKSVGKPIKKKKTERKAILSSQSRKIDPKLKAKQNITSPKHHNKIAKKKKNEASFTMKSCQPPKTQPMHKITFEGDIYSDEKDEKSQRIYQYITQYPPIPQSYHRQCGNIHQYPAEQIQDFQYKNHSIHQSIDEAMLMQLQKELLQLYQQQENLIQISNNQFSTQQERGEYIGRLKMLNEQLRIKNQKVCELKAKI